MAHIITHNSASTFILKIKIYYSCKGNSLMRYHSLRQNSNSLSNKDKSCPYYVDCFAYSSKRLEVYYHILMIAFLPGIHDRHETVQCDKVLSIESPSPYITANFDSLDQHLEETHNWCRCQGRLLIQITITGKLN